LLLRKLDAPLVHVHTASRGSFWRKFVVCCWRVPPAGPTSSTSTAAASADFYDEESGWLGRRLIRSTLRTRRWSSPCRKNGASGCWKSVLLARVEVLHNAVAIPDIQGLRASTTATRRYCFSATCCAIRASTTWCAPLQKSHKFPRAKLVLGGGTGARGRAANSPRTGDCGSRVLPGLARAGTQERRAGEQPHLSVALLCRRHAHGAARSHVMGPTRHRHPGGRYSPGRRVTK
jgi:hypothetical protein